MNSAVPGRTTDSSSPEREEFAATRTRRPFVGLALLLVSLVFSLAVLIYFGAWASADRIENRASAAGVTSSSGTPGAPGTNVEGEWWEDGLLFVCPLH